MWVKFTKSPAGKYSLAYDPGDEVDLPDQQAKDLIEDQYAIPIQVKPETAQSKKPKEKR